MELVISNNTIVTQLNEVQDNVIQNSNQLNEVEEDINELKQFKETFGNVEELVNSMRTIAANNKKTDQEIAELKLKMDEETKILNEAKTMMNTLSQKNAAILAKDPNILTFFNEIKFETEEENEKFISELNKKGIEIKMETPTSPEEDQIDDI